MIELGLQRISRLLAKTPLPWRAIHVAGTNGKGSICAYVSSMLETYNNSNLRVEMKHGSRLKHARFTTPHLIDRWDCITINQQTVTSKLFEHIERQVLRRNEQEEIKASEFELLTATAFEIFTHEQVDVGVVEVGMGGRLDATNIIGQQEGFSTADADHYRPLPLVTAISKIGLDHQAFLGNTIQEIAREKMGIFKPGVPVIIDFSNPTELIDVVNGQIRESKAMISLELWSEHHLNFQRDTLLRWNCPDHVRGNLQVALGSTVMGLRGLGRLMSLPASRFVGIKDEVRETLMWEMLTTALETTKFPGRLQELSIEALTGRAEKILLDGAHNAQSAQALAWQVSLMRAHQQSSPSEAKEGRPVTWVLACSSTKDVQEILQPLLRAGDSVFTVEFGLVDGMPWVQPKDSRDLADTVGTVMNGHGNVEVQACGQDVLSALRLASAKARGGSLVIAGSLYLVGDVLRLLRDHGGQAR